MAAKHGLGRGLGALINDANRSVKGDPPPGAIPRVPVDRIERNPWQPRRTFDEAAMAELVESVRQRGVLQPLLVRMVEDRYQLIAGERRLRAAMAAGLKDVPVIVVNGAADGDSMELALVENLQRQDLNIIEEAEGYRALADKFGMTQEQIAQRLGKSRAGVANALRILTLPDEVRHMVGSDVLSAGHAKLLAGIESATDQLMLARRVAEVGLSVRALEKLLRQVRKAPRHARTAKTDLPDAHLVALSDQMQAHFGTRVRIVPSRTYANGRKGRGAIEIDFYSNDDLDRIIALLGLTVD